MQNIFAFYGNLPVIRGFKVRNKILVAFLLILVVFTFGLVVIYNSSTQLARVNENVVNKLSISRTESFEISLGFEEQQALYKTYDNGGSINAKAQFISNQIILDANITKLSNLLAGTSEQNLITYIQQNSSIFSNAVVNGVFNFPNSKQISGIEFDASTMLSDLTNMYSSIVDYEITNSTPYISAYEGYKVDFNSYLSQYTSTVNEIQSINTQIYTEFSQFYTTLNSDFNSLITTVFDPAINSAPVGTQWVLTNKNSVNTVRSDLAKISSNIPVFDNLANSLLVVANSDLQPILNDLTLLRSISDSQLSVARQDSVNASNLVTETTFIVLVVGIILTLVIALSISNTISNPLEDLTKKSQIIASGDLTLQLDMVAMNQNDEISKLTTHFNQMGNSLKETISDISQAVITLNTAAQEMASSTEEVNSSGEEISAITQEMAKGSIEQKNKIVSAVEISLSLKKDFEENSQSIYKTSTLIESIANKVNMLALNASIEAARAGEYGRGFSVVADNIRRLADDSKASVTSVNTIINTMKTNLSKSIDNLTNSIESISVIAEKNAAGSEESSAAMEEQTATMEEMSASAQELALIANNLERITNKFKTSS